MLARRTSLFVGSVAVVIALLVAVGSVAAFYNRQLNVADPETEIDFTSVDREELVLPVIPPRLSLPGPIEYSEVARGETIDAPDGRPVAQLANPPASLSGSVGVHFSEIGEVPEDVLAFTVLSIVQYSGDENVLVTTSRQSGPEDQPFVLGHETVTLANGVKAWASNKAEAHPDSPYEVVMIHDDLIITLASSLSIDVLMELAADVVVTSTE